MKYSYETIKQQEIGVFHYTEVSRTAAPLNPVKESRFVKSGNLWINPAAKKTNRATIMIAGDLMCQERFIAGGKTSDSPESYDFNYALEDCAKVFRSSDFAMGNLEAVIHPEAPYSNEKLYLGDVFNRNAPPDYLHTLKASGIDMLTTANNHTLDTGLRGLYRTCEFLDQYSMIHIGTYTDTDKKHWALVDINGIKVGIINYTKFTNVAQSNYITAEVAEQLIDYYSIKRVEKAIAELRREKAEYIICCMHWGREFVYTASDIQKNNAKELANAGVDFIAGSHPHVLQPFDVITADDGRKVPVAYSIGNLVSHFSHIPRKSSVVLELSLQKDESGAISADVRYIPFFTFSDGYKYQPRILCNQMAENDCDIMQEQLEWIRKTLGSRIQKSTRFDAPEDLSFIVPPKAADEKKYSLTPKDTTAVQKKLLKQYRLTEAYRDYYGYYMVDTYPRGESVTKVISIIKKFLHKSKIDIEPNRKLIADIVYTKNVLGFWGWEYFVYGFQNLSIEQRCEFLAQNEIEHIFDVLNHIEGRRILNSKIKTAEKYSKFLKRDVILLRGEEDIPAFRDFVEKHHRFIKKPVSGALGKGVSLCTVNDSSKLDEFIDQYRDELPLICEELIISDDSFAAIHPQSVNSLRVFTYHNGTEPRIICAWLKAGRGDAIIDNGSSGGMLAAVDEKTGIVSTIARDEANNDFTVHPDTGFAFKGYQIPRWNELVDFVKEIADLDPELKCVGWDIALSKDLGWQMIEGNAHGMVNVIQVATRTGMRQKFFKAVEWDRNSR